MFGSIFGSVAGSVLGSVTSSLLGGGSSGGSSGGSGFSMTDLIGPALQIGGSLLAGQKNNESNEQINAHNLRLAQDQLEWQRQYAHNRLQWQVEDAKKAGLHPMVAAGLSPVSFSPVSASLTPNNYDWVGNIGQSLGYAATKAKTNKQQQQALDFQVKLADEQLNGVRLDNELKVMQILGMLSELNNSGPAAPDINGGKNLIGGQNDSPFMDKPIVRDGWLIDEKGRKVGIIPSDDLAQRTEDKLVIEWLPWAGSSVRAARAKYLGQEVAGHWWHGDDKGFLPYPPKNNKLKSRGSFSENVRNAVRFYRDYDYND